MAWGYALAAGADYLLGRHSAKKAAEYQNDATRQLWLDAPSLQMEGFRRAGLNPMLAYGRIDFPGSSANVAATQSNIAGAMAAGEQAEAATRTSTASAAKMEQETKTESFRTAVVQNDAIKGNYALRELAGKLDAAERMTGKLGADAISALEQPRIKAGLAELRAAFASADNDAAVFEALNSKAVQIALDVLGRVTGTGNAIAGAVDRYRARSQRGDIINLNKD
jgi:hypothetical protein